jgi:DNA-binding CsgD family transcriptional regulator
MQNEQASGWMEQVGRYVTDQLDVPLVIVDGALAVTWSNRAAQARRGAVWAVLFDKDAPCTVHFALRSQLQDLVRACLRQRAEQETLLESHEGTWFATGAPLQGRSGLVLLRLSAMHQMATGVRERLHRLFGLTQAESHITIQLANGASLDNIAQERGVSVDTVRAQVRSIFKKTGIHRQGELICAVGRLAVG